MKKLICNLVLAVGVLLFIHVNRLDAAVIGWETVVDFDVLVEQGQSYDFSYNYNLPKAINSSNLLAAGLLFNFKDDPGTQDSDYLKTTYHSTEVKTGQKKKETTKFFYNTKVETIDRTYDRTSTMTSYYWNRKETVEASVGNTSQEGSTPLVPRKQYQNATKVGTDKTQKYSNSMNNSKFLYEANLFSAYMLFMMGLWDLESPWDYGDYTDYRDDQWEKYENTETTHINESVMVEDGYSGAFLIDILLDDTMKAMLLNNDPLDFSLNGKLGDAYFTSAKLWARYDKDISAIPEASTLILLGIGLGALARYSRKLKK